MKSKINNIKLKFQEFEGKNLIIQGWIKGLRKGKENCFMDINDGSSLESIQVFFPSSFKQKKELEQLNFGSSIEINGILNLTPKRKQKFELIADQIIDFNIVSNIKYPLQKKSLPISFVREYSQFRAKTNYFFAMFKIRSEISKFINKFFEKNDFFYINTPIITSNDAEGGGESFSIKEQNKEDIFFPKKANLTVSGQLHAESLAQGLGKVYNFSPCFRAEKSNTTRHLSEFWMIEAEITFSNLNEIIKISEELIKYVIDEILKNNKSEMKYFQEHSKNSDLIKELEDIAKKKFPIITYSRCIKIIEKKNKENLDFFEYNEIFWGMDLKSEHEKYIAKRFNSPVFVIDYPIELKSFYMKENEDKKTVACMDLIFPRIGEMIGGSVRENSYEVLEKKTKLLNINNENLNWYLLLRKSGYAPSAGFGMGLERLITFICGSDNIKDSIPFPRYFKSLDF